MEFRYRYLGKSTAVSDSRSTELSFSPDSLRPPAYFVGQLQQRLGFREAISALHDVVISDQRFKPKDQTEYRAWLKQNEQACSRSSSRARASSRRSSRAMKASSAVT